MAGFVFEQFDQNSSRRASSPSGTTRTARRRWSRTYAGYLATGAAAAYHIAIDPAGDIVVSGSTNQGDDWAVVKYDPDGTERWRHVYEADSTYLTEPEDMAIDAEGNIYLVGDVGDPINPGSGVIVKISTDGAEAWGAAVLRPRARRRVLQRGRGGRDGGIYAAGGAVVPGPRLGPRGREVRRRPGTSSGTSSTARAASLVHDRAMDVVVDGNGDIVAVGGFGFNSPIGVDVADPEARCRRAQSLGRAIYDGPDDAPTRRPASLSTARATSSSSATPTRTSTTPTRSPSSTTPHGGLALGAPVAGDEIHFDWATSVAVDDHDNIYVAGGYDPIGVTLLRDAHAPTARPSGSPTTPDRWAAGARPTRSRSAPTAASRSPASRPTSPPSSTSRRSATRRAAIAPPATWTATDS